jgi:hypothetical protein
MVAVEVQNDTLLIYQQLSRSSASGRGVSYWDNDNDAVCGKRLQLAAIHKEAVAAAETHIEEKKLGTYFHGLMEMWMNGKLAPGMVLDVGPIQDAEWNNALRLFNFMKEHFTREYFGDVVGAEIKLPVNEDHKAKVREYFGHDEITGAIDAMTMLSAADVARLEAEWNIRLDGPGLYLIDWKTSGARKNADAAKSNYTESMQAMTYPTLWNLAGGQQCKGMIYFVIVKHVKLRRHDLDPKNLSSVQVFFAKHQPEHAAIVKNTINEARRMRDAGVANAFACYSNNRECAFLRAGICGRI